MKKKTRNKNWRHVYFYTCKGPCARRRATFDHDRAVASICTKCEPEIISPDQTSLLPLSTGEVFTDASRSLSVEVLSVKKMA